MKKVFFALFLALALIGCKKDDTSDKSQIKFRNGKDGYLTIAVAASEVISIDGAKMNELVIESSDTNVVYIYDGVMYGLSKGTCIVTAYLKNNPDNMDALQVTVDDYAALIEWNQAYWMQKAEDWQDVKHSVIRMRRYRGVELPDAGDAKLIGVYNHEGDTADIQSWVDEVESGHWYYLYCNEEGDSIGLFEDSVRSVRSWLLSTDAYFNGDGEFTVNGQGALLEYTDFYMFDIKYSYCLGGRKLCDDVTAEGEQFVKTGKQRVPYPGYIQVGHFNPTMYLDFFTRAFNGEDVDRKDFPWYGKYDSKLMIYANKVDSETGEAYMGGYDFGYPLVDNMPEDFENFDLESDDATGWFKMGSYYFEVNVWPEYYNYSLKTVYNEQGQLVLTDPLEMAESVKYTYSKEAPEAARATNGVRRSNSEKPVLTKSLNKQQSVTNTIGATLRMVLSTVK